MCEEKRGLPSDEERLAEKRRKQRIMRCFLSGCDRLIAGVSFAPQPDSDLYSWTLHAAGITDLLGKAETQAGIAHIFSVIGAARL